MQDDKPLNMYPTVIDLNRPAKLYDVIKLKDELPKKDALREHLKDARRPR